MAKLINLKDYILLSAAIVGEASEELRLVGGLWPKALETQYGFVPPNFKKKSYLSTVSRLLSVNLIERKIDKKGNPVLELTSGGLKEYTRRFPIFSIQKDKWDGYFMQVIFDIPEKERGVRFTLRDKLKELGFGMLQESVWISPYHFEEDLNEFLNAFGLMDFVYVMTVKKIIIGNIRSLAQKVWNIEEVNERYFSLLTKMKNMDIKEIYEEYFGLLANDPFLPKEFLPTDWKREELSIEIEKLALTKNRRSALKNQL